MKLLIVFERLNNNNNNNNNNLRFNSSILWIGAITRAEECTCSIAACMKWKNPRSGKRRFFFLLLIPNIFMQLKRAGAATARASCCCCSLLAARAWQLDSVKLETLSVGGYFLSLSRFVLILFLFHIVSQSQPSVRPCALCNTRSRLFFIQSWNRTTFPALLLSP